MKILSCNFSNANMRTEVICNPKMIYSKHGYELHYILLKQKQFFFCKNALVERLAFILNQASCLIEMFALLDLKSPLALLVVHVRDD